VLFLKGYEACVQTVYLMSRAVVGERKIDSMQSLRGMYLDALERLSPDLKVGKATLDPQRLIVPEGEREKRLARLFSQSVLDDLQQSNVMGKSSTETARDRQSEALDMALNLLERQYTEFVLLFRLVIHGVILRDIVTGQAFRSARAGTTSSAPGVIWMTSMPDFGTLEMSEILIHELAHTMLFIDEIIHPQFNNVNLKAMGKCCKSPILQQRRPLDKVVHGIVVATEIVLARNTVLATQEPDKSRAHPETRLMARNVIDCAWEVLAINRQSEVITPHAQELVEACSTSCRNYLEQGVAA
jgi:HEXXH motif-containing protein